MVIFAGSLRDADEQLEPLCEDWLRIKGEVTNKKASCKYKTVCVQSLRFNYG